MSANRTFPDFRLPWLTRVLTRDPRSGRETWPESSCYRCRTSWRFVQGHVTRYSDGSGCFPLCERCWADITPEARLPYYRRLHSEWVRQTYLYLGGDPDELKRHEETWPKIQQAVLSGK